MNHLYTVECQIFPTVFLNWNPVDSLVVERCSVEKAPSASYIHPWETAIAATKEPLRPKVVLESWNPICNTWANGPTEKGCITRWKKLGYQTRIKLIRCIDVGGSLNQTRLFVARTKSEYSNNWFWPSFPSKPLLRPMTNLLSPPGLKRHRYIQHPKSLIILDATKDIMPSHPQVLIKTEKGIRFLDTDKFYQGLGFSKSKSEMIDGGGLHDGQPLCIIGNIFPWFV